MTVAKPETPQPLPDAPSRPRTSSAQPVAESSSANSLYALRVIIGVAFLVATLFTAWTPGNSLWSAFNLSSSDSFPSAIPTRPYPTGTPHSRPLVGVVVGHWQNDSGAVCPDGLQEVDINLTIATLVQKFLIQAGFDVELLAEYDPKLQGYQASALISIHADSCEFVDDKTTGFKVAAALGTRYPERAARLIDCVVSRYRDTTHLPLHTGSITEDMTLYHAFGEVDPNTPVAIIETGFMNLDRAFLTQTPELAAEGIAKGIICFIRNETIATPTPTSVTTPNP